MYELPKDSKCPRVRTPPDERVRGEHGKRAAVGSEDTDRENAGTTKPSLQGSNTHSPGRTNKLTVKISEIPSQVPSSGTCLDS